MLKKLLIVILSLGCVTQSMTAQTIKDTMVTINPATHTPEIKNSEKIFDLPEYRDSVKKIPSLNYAIQPKQMHTSYKPEPIKQARMAGEPLAKLYRTQLKAGIGNYSTPYGEVWFNSLRSKDYSYELHGRHLSSAYTAKGFGYAGFSDNELNAYGKRFIAKQILWGSLDYARNSVHFYGYDVNQFDSIDKKSTAQRFNFINGQIGLYSYYTDTNHINHDIRIGYYNLNDLYKVSENNFIVDAKVSGYIKGIQPVLVAASVDYYNHQMEHDTVNNTLFRLQPTFSGSGKKWRGNIGVSVTMDHLNDSSKFYVFPLMNVSYNLIDNILIPYAGFKGGVQKNSFRSLSQQNPFVVSDLKAVNYRNGGGFDAFLGLKGAISKSTSFDLSVTYAEQKNMALFVTNYTTNGMNNRFSVVYDQVKLYRSHGEMIVEKNERIKFIAKGNYYVYTTKDQAKAWYKPQYDLTFSAVYNLRSKFVFTGDIFWIGKQYALTLENNTLAPKQLKGFADINLGAEYRYTKLLSGFVKFNNIGAFRYYRWNNYPLQSFNLMLGVSLAF